jgi:hypothetical protein
MKKSLLLALLVVLIAFNIKSIGNKNIYPDTLIIDKIDTINDVVIGRTVTGMLYSFEGCEDWQIGDIAAVIMNDNGTKDTVTDDRIINVRYTGYSDNF